MKKLITIIISLILVAVTLVACSKTNSNTNEATESGTQAQAVEQTKESTTPSTANASTTAKNTVSKYVIVSFNSVQGAVIYKQDYDINGYLESCQYHKNVKPAAMSAIQTDRHAETCILRIIVPNAEIIKK